MTTLRSLCLVLALAACGGGYTEPDRQGTTPPPPPPPGGNPSLQGNVSMKGTGDGYGGTAYTYDPSSVTIAQTGTVTWTNGTLVAHNVTFSPATGAPANVQDFATGSVSRSFPTAGTYSYTCTNHVGMNGQVIVQ